jgi:glutathione peroxidase-family protein
MLDPERGPVENMPRRVEVQMGLKAAQAARIYLACLLVASSPGCAWESGTPHQDDGGDADARDAGTDEGPFYPPGPYGTDYLDTVENFTVLRSLCPGGPAQGRELELADLLGSKAILVTAHSGHCPHCRSQASTMETELYQPYRSQGFKILLVLIDDESGNDDRQSILDFCCEYQQTYGMTFVVAADPEAQVMRKYLAATPMNMLLDDEMVIRYKVEGNLPDPLKGNVEALLNE